MGEPSAREARRLSGWQRHLLNTEKSPTPALRATSPIKGEENPENKRRWIAPAPLKIFVG
jgi:hypothetical protein